MAESSSAPAAAEKARLRAEARRRRILENAESRMRFVTGRSNTLGRENQKKDETSHLDCTQTDVIETSNVEHDIRKNNKTELKSKFQEPDRQPRDTAESESAILDDVTNTLDSAVQAFDDNRKKSSDVYVLSPFLRAVIVFLIGLSYHLALQHPEMLELVRISPSWLGHSVLFGFLSVYIPTIILLSTRLGRFIGVKVSTKTNIAVTMVVYSSALIGLPADVGRWFMWIFLVASNSFVDLAATLIFFFLLFINDN